MKPDADRCRCGCPQHAHTGAWGVATACTGSCGCSYFETDEGFIDRASQADNEAWRSYYGYPVMA